MVAVGLKGNFISRLFPKNVCVERHNSRSPRVLKIATFGEKAERNDRKELKWWWFWWLVIDLVTTITTGGGVKLISVLMVITQDLLITCFCNIWIDRQSIVVGNVQVLCTYTCQQYIWPASSCGGCSLCTRALLHLVSQIMQLHFQHDWFQSLSLEICCSCFIPFWVNSVQIKG